MFDWFGLIVWFPCVVYRIIYICISMGGQLDGNFPGSLPHKFILIVTLIICFVVNKFFFSLSFLSICSAVTWLQCRKRRPNGPFTHTLRVSLSCCWAARCWAARCVTAQEIVTQCRPISGPAQSMHVWTGPAYTVYTVRYTNRPFTHQRKYIRNVSWPMTQSFLLRPSCDPLSSWSSRVDIKWRWTKTRVQYTSGRRETSDNCCLLLRCIACVLVFLER